MKIAIGSDHAGYDLKLHLALVLRGGGHTVEDVGPTDAERVDYPDYAHWVAKMVADGSVDMGVLVCGSGIGMSITANRTPGVRAVNAVLEYQAEFARLHNNANVLCLGARVVGEGLAERLLERFISTTFEGGRHQTRVDKIDQQS